MTSLVQSPIFIGAAAFLAGFMIARITFSIGVGVGRWRHSKTGHQVRSLEAELRVANKKIQSAQDRAASSKEELAELRKESNTLQELMTTHSGELSEAQVHLEQERAKTAELQKQLARQADEMIRAKTNVREAEAQLSVVQAGSEVVQDEIDKLCAEKDELTGTLRALEHELESVGSD